MKFLTSALIVGLSFFNCSSNSPQVIPEGMMELPGGYYATPNVYYALEFMAKVYSGDIEIKTGKNGGIKIGKVDLETPANQIYLGKIAKRANQDEKKEISEEEAKNFMGKFYSKF